MKSIILRSQNNIFSHKNIFYVFYEKIIILQFILMMPAVSQQIHKQQLHGFDKSPSLTTDGLFVRTNKTEIITYNIHKLLTHDLSQ